MNMQVIHLTLDRDGHLRLWMPRLTEWIYVDWSWVMASLSTARSWSIHVVGHRTKPQALVIMDGVPA